MNPRLAHLVGLLTIIGPQIAVVWQDQQASLANKIAMSLVTLLTLLLTDSKKHAAAVTLARVGVAVGALVLSALLTKGTLGTVGTSVATTALAVFVRLQALLPPAPAPAVQVEDKTANIRPPVGPGAAAVVVLLGALLLAGAAWAEGPQFGGCVAGGRVCFGPSATVTVGQFNFATSKFSGGIVPGVGYGATYAPQEWYATGLAGYLAFTVGQGAPNEAIPSLMVSFANYLRLGAGVSITETAGPVETQWRLLFGVGSDFGGSPKYVASQGAR